MTWLIPLSLSILIIFSGVAFSAENAKAKDGMASFTGLQSHYLKNEGVTLYYNPERSRVLPGSHPDADKHDKSGVYISRVLRAELLGVGKGHFVIDCDSGGSGDPGCTILKENNGHLKKINHIMGLNFAFPCNGIIYVDGHNNTMFNVRKKYEWKNRSFIEIKQPYNYVGLDSITKKPIQIYSSKEYKQVVANLPKGAPVFVLLNEGENYLIKTPFGLLGWHKIRDGIQNESTLEGIYWAGD